MQRIRHGIPIGLLALTVMISSAAWAVTAQIAPSRTTGVAPLAVYFDALASSAPGADPIHDLHYEWDFGDPAAGTWAQSGMDKNAATGPWAAHVFDKGGTYTVRVTVTAPDGSQHQRTRTINVSSADAFYSGTSTVCVSAGGNFSGCPAGAQLVTESNFNVGLSHRGQNKRVLFRRGDSFTSASTVGINAPGPATIGAFGVGATPRVQSSQAGPVIRVSGKTPQFSDWRIMDLDFRGPGTKSSSVVSSNGTALQLLLYRISADNYHSPALFPAGIINFFGQSKMNDEIALVECSFTDIVGGSGGNGTYAASNRLMLLGNSIVDSTQAEHVVRIKYVGGGVISHNFLSTPAVGKTVVKLHAVTVGPSRSYSERDSHHFIVSHNTFQGGNNAWSVNFGPQNSITDERVLDGIVENNYFLAGVGTRTHLKVWGSGISVRNNIFNMNGGSTYAAVSIGQRGIEPPPADVRAYNNTCYTSDAAGSPSCVKASGVASNTTAVNNMIYAPQAGSATAATATGNVHDNAVVTQNPFVSSSPSSPADFRLAANGPAVDAGGSISWLGSDFSGGTRPTDGDGNGAVQWDLGAFELGGGGGTLPPPPPAAPAAPVLLP